MPQSRHLESCVIVKPISRRHKPPIGAISHRQPFPRRLEAACCKNQLYVTQYELTERVHAASVKETAFPQYVVLPMNKYLFVLHLAVHGSSKRRFHISNNPSVDNSSGGVVNCCRIWCFHSEIFKFRQSVTAEILVSQATFCKRRQLRGLWSRCEYWIHALSSAHRMHDFTDFRRDVTVQRSCGSR